MLDLPLDPEHFADTDRPIVPFLGNLDTFGDRTAVITATEVITYRELTARADVVTASLGPTRRLVALAAANTVDTLVTYLGALRGGHVVLLLPGDHPGSVASSVADLYDPDVVAGAGPTGRWALDVRRPGTAHTLHPDLALLLSTSGSTGSPKLVRLSHDNLQSNAAAIAESLGIGPDDIAATTLPMHYCYGLSVVHSHLLTGAGLILTDLSVSEAPFWNLFRRAGGTAFAGVPYTFDLLDRAGFADLDLPALRYVTQAGGRLAPDRVLRYAALGRERGWELVVMYGQTEATARMAYLPPHLTATRPGAIGVAVPGGSFRIDDGELVYQGPNVMLGYAEGPADLALGREVTELRTGDLARRGADGLYEIVGRRSRFLKLFGLRIDLARVEDLIQGLGWVATCAGTDDHLVVAIAVPPGASTLAAPALAAPALVSADHVAARLTREYSLPRHALTVHVVDELPRLATGKPDYDAVRRLAPGPDRGRDGGSADIGAALCDLYTEVLGHPAGRSDTFSGLGGDSLSFVVTSIRVERLLGRLPDDWQHLPIGDLAALAGPVARHRATVDLSVVLRAVAIILVVTQHAKVLPLHGGAHIMLGVAGYNLARFQFDDEPAGQRIRRALASLTRIVIPTILWVAVVLVVVGDYSPINLFLGYYLTGAVNEHHEAQLWFIEVIVFYVLGAALLVASPWGYRLERRHPFALPMTLAGLGLIPRVDLVPGLTASPYVSNGVTPLVLVWVFAIGWAAARADRLWQKVLVTATILVAVPGFFGYRLEDEIVAGGLIALVWFRTLPSTALVNRVLAVLAASSLFIYVTHYQVFVRFTWAGDPNLLGVAASMVFGVAYAALAKRIRRPAWLSWRRLYGSRHG